MPYIGNVTTSSNVNGSQINNGTITGDKLSLPFDYDSATLYLDNTNNRVGVLTASPSSTLTVGTGGVVSIPLASAATPSLIFGTDTNTGIYSPGADQVAISTNGTGRLFIDANGVATGGAAVAGYGGLQVRNNFIYLNEDGANTVQMYLRTSASEPAIQIATAHPFVIKTSNQERLRITAAGLVGVGTSSPGAILHSRQSVLAGAAYRGLATLITESSADNEIQILSGSTNYGQLRFGDADSNYRGAVVYEHSSDSFRFVTAASDRVVIDSSGRVGIGTSSPAFALDISAPSDAVISARTNSSTSAGFVGTTNNGANNWFIGARKDTIGGSSGTDRFNILYGTSPFLTIATGGNVGIGTTAPSQTLGVAGGVGIGNQLSTGTTGSIKLVSSGGTNYIQSGQNTSNSSAAPLVFTDYNAFNEWARIDSSGRLGIGVSAPSSNGNLTVLMPGANGTGIVVRAQATGGSGSQSALVFEKPDGTINSRIVSDIGTGYLALHQNGTDRLVIDNSGRVGIGTTGPSTALHVVSNTTQALFEGATQGNINIQKVGTNGFGIYSDAAGTLNFYDNNSASLRLKLDSSGRLLVGTSTAQTFAGLSSGAKIQSGANNDYAGVAIVSSIPTAAYPSHLTFAKTRGLTTSSRTIVNNGDEIGLISFQGADGSNFIRLAGISGEVDGTPGTNDMPGRLVFSTTADGASSPTERMRIANNGSVQIGSGGQLATERFRVTSTSTWGAAIENGNNTSGDRNLYLTLGTNCNNTSSYFIDCTTATVGPKFYVYGNGTYGTVSDINLKKNVETTRDGYLDDIQKLRVVKYNWNTDDDSAPKELGWIAQELAEVFPGLVQDSQPDSDGNTVKEVKTSVLPFILLKALQEAAEQIKELQAEVAALKAA